MSASPRFMKGRLFSCIAVSCDEKRFADQRECRTISLSCLNHHAILVECEPISMISRADELGRERMGLPLGDVQWMSFVVMGQFDGWVPTMFHDFTSVASVRKHRSVVQKFTITRGDEL